MTRPVLLMLPGLLCDAAVWAPQVEALSEQADCRVPSYGLLDSLPAMARHVLDGAPPGRFALAGHSMGGRVALEVLRQAPQRVERLLLADSGIDPLDDGDAGQRERDGRMALLALARRKGMREMARQWARGMVHADAVGGPVFEAVLDMLERSSPDVYAAQIAALLARPDARDVFAAATCPTWLLCGRHDAWSTYERHERMQALRPGTRLVAIEAAGHMVTMEQPDAVSATMADWLRAPA